jgi:predicted nucleic acid-binding protein
MNPVFADTYFFIALLNRDDEWHKTTHAFTADFAGQIVTTTWVLTELGNTLAKKATNRGLFLSLLGDLRNDQRVRIVAAGQDLFDRGIALYAPRLDKQWSVTDCISFVVMQDEGITDALTADHHFEQAGFTILLKPP